MRQQALIGGLAVVAMILGTNLAHGQKAQTEKVYRGLPSKELESILKELDIKFKKAPGERAGVFFYDFERNQFKFRLYNYNGSDLWIDASFPKLTLPEINRWN